MIQPLDVALFHSPEFRIIPLHTAYPETRTCSCGRPDCGNSIGKHPRIDDWQTQATRDPETIRRWFTTWPRAGIGLAMGGPERLIALDVDGPVGRESLAAFPALPRTRVHKSGREDGGRHYFFRVPNDWDLSAIKNNAGKIGPKLDVRSQGGQVVAPGTVHVSGVMYDVEDESPIADLPRWLYEKFTEAGSKKAPVTPRAVTEEDREKARWLIGLALEKLRSAQPGALNNTLNETAYTVGGLTAMAQDMGAKEKVRALAVSMGLQRIDGTLDHAFDDGAAHPFDFAQYEAALAEAEKGEFERLRDSLIKADSKAEILYSDPFIRGFLSLTGANRARMHAIIGAELKALRNQPDGGAGTLAQWEKHAAKVEKRLRPEAEKDDRPPVEISRDAFEAVDATLKAVGERLPVFQRGNALVEIAQQDDSKAIVAIDPQRLWYLAPQACWYFKMIETDEVIRKVYLGSEVPRDVLAACIVAPEYGPEIKKLDGIVRQPLLLPSGAVASAAGYHGGARQFLDFDPGEFPEIPERPTLDDARAGLQFLADLFADFPLDSPEDLSVVLSLILTGIGLDAFEGCSPLHVFNGTDPGVGKTLLAQLCTLISSGERVGGDDWYTSEEEWIKFHVSEAVRGTRHVLIDNVPDGAELKSNAIEKILTDPRAKGRILGESKTVDIPWKPVRSVTGNNVRMGGALDRRSLMCRLQKTWEVPEDRTFKINDLEAHIKENRPALYMAGLMALKAFIDAGKPSQIVPLPSFEPWSRLVPATLVWAGYPNPLAKVASRDETTENPLEDLIAGLMSASERLKAEEVKRPKPRAYILAGGFTTKDILDLWKRDLFGGGTPELQRAFEAFFSNKERQELTAKKVGELFFAKKESPCRGSKLTYLLENGKPRRDHVNVSVWSVSHKIRDLAGT